jgi:hypothetical protein
LIGRRGLVPPLSFVLLMSLTTGVGGGLEVVPVALQGSVSVGGSDAAFGNVRKAANIVGFFVGLLRNCAMIVK